MQLNPQRTVVVDFAPSGQACLGLIRATGILMRPFRHKGLYRISRWLAHRVSLSPTFRVALRTGVSLDLPVVAYWLRLAVPSYEYEPELYRVLAALSDFDYQFIDCGANVGYWSALVGHANLGSKSGVAVEAGSQAFGLLAANLRNSGSAITPLRFAIALYDDQTAALSFRIGEACDAGASIARADSVDGRPMTVESVPTITFDSLVARQIRDPDAPLVVKLDIEGVEVSVIQTSAELVRRDCLLIVEDHGNDLSCQVTRALHARGFRTAYLDEAGGGFWYASPSDLAREKTNPGKGYNIVAIQPGSRFESAIDEALKKRSVAAMECWP